jgi:hypothetical protein
MPTRNGKNQFLDAVRQKALPPAIFGIPPTQSARVQQAISSRAPIRQDTNAIQMTGGQQFISDIAETYWFSFLQPIRPVAPQGFRPRQAEFIPGANLLWTPGEDKGGVTFEALRTLADSWDLLRVIIETRKDQLCTVPWVVRVRRDPGETQSEYKKRNLGDSNVKKLTEFFRFPDGFHNWRSWMRMWFEDMLVLDAVALYKQRDKNGRVANIMPLDGGTIARMLNDQGITPSPPDIAYQQVLYGTPSTNLTVDDLLYYMRNERTSKRYGYSPVEQILVTIGIGLRKEMFLTEYYTSGNMPEALCFLPSTLSPSRIQEIQEWFDSVLAGDLSKRRRLTFLPGYGSGTSGSGNVQPNVVFPKQVLLKDELDDWLMRLVCYAFSVSPQNLMKQMNRASAQQASEVAEEEGLAPSLVAIQDIHNQILVDLGFGDDYEWTFQEKGDVDPLRQAQIDTQLVGKLYSINELREKRGDDPRPEPEADELGVLTPQGWVSVTDEPVAFQQADAMFAGGQPEQGDDEDDEDEGESTADKTSNQSIVPTQSQAITSKKVTKIVRLDGRKVVINHPVYGNLNSYDKFFAYDPDTNQVLVKGDVNLEEAVTRFKKEYPLAASKMYFNGHLSKSR